MLEGIENASNFRNETRSKNSPKKLATPEENSQLDSDCQNPEAPKNIEEDLPEAGDLEASVER